MQRTKIISLPVFHGQKKHGVETGSKAILRWINSSYDHEIIAPRQPFSYQDMVQDTVEITRQHKRNIFLGGDHSISLASIHSTLSKYPDAKILWIDAHPDINTWESSPSKNIHGMVLSILTGSFTIGSQFSSLQCINHDQIAYLGLRSIDPHEQQVIDQNSILKLSTDDVIRNPESLHVIKSWLGNHPVHVSFDIDVMDAELVPGTGTPVTCGLKEEELTRVIELIRGSNWKGIDMVEVNPLLDRDDRTSMLAARIIDSIIEEN